MRKYYNNRTNKKLDTKNKVIKRQIDEIESLKQMVSDLQVDCNEKDNVIESIESIRNDLLEIVEELKEKSKECDELINEVIEMRNSIDKYFFKKRWKLIRLLLK